MGWALRKAIGFATITVHINEYPDSENSKVMHIDSDQTLTGGIKGTTEIRCTDGKERDHRDHIFGHNKGQSFLIRGAKGEDGKVRPNVTFRSKLTKEADKEKAFKFLKGEILSDGSPSEGFTVDPVGDDYGEGEGLYMNMWVVNVDSGWTAEGVSTWDICSAPVKRLFFADPFFLFCRSGALRSSMASVAMFVGSSLWPRMANMN